MVIDCGEISFVVILFVVFEVISSELFVLICCVIEVWIGVNKELLLIIELVINMLI